MKSVVLQMTKGFLFVGIVQLKAKRGTGVQHRRILGLSLVFGTIAHFSLFLMPRIKGLLK